MLLALLSLFPREEIIASVDVDTGCFVLTVVGAAVTGMLLVVLGSLKVVDVTLDNMVLVETGAFVVDAVSKLESS